ncbi:UvrB/UvrC motif-containing protein [Bacillus kwashiorkori]|uniref:UvrB/UvrC motif-containing protein n=1 Tax=Bacillus kwashiorkori TaxID=1522318 RepID=UPI000785EF7C|nr:UvrB/UvrC motif-containing protein [Bacillus kwashiorkori]
MNCEQCQKRPATFHFTKIINGEKTEINLCEQCAQEQGELFTFNHSPSFSINNLLAGLFNSNPFLKKSSQDENLGMLQCHTCGMTFTNFLKVGRFGCSGCYSSFKEQLTPIVKRLHSGNAVHNGKIPERAGGVFQTRKKIETLKTTMQKLVEAEEFEKAAQVRDEIRSLENKLKEGGE